MNECDGVAFQYAADSLLMHTNACHPQQLRALAASVSGRRVELIISAELVFVCVHGFQISWLDVSGGNIVPMSFERAAQSPGDLAALLGSYLCE